MLDDRVSSVKRFSIHLDPLCGKIRQPGLRNSRASVRREFHKAIVFERCVGDFYNEQNIGWSWQRARIEIITPTKKRQIRLRLRIIIKPDRALYSNNYVE